MNQIVFFDGPQWKSLLPLTYLRPTCLCMVGARTIQQKWEESMGARSCHVTVDYLSSLYPFVPSDQEKIYLNGACLPSNGLVEEINKLQEKEVLVFDDHIIAFKTSNNIASLEEILMMAKRFQNKKFESSIISYPEDILSASNDEFLKDYLSLTSQRQSAKVNDSVKLRGPEIFIGSDVKIHDAIINSVDGPIYIDDRAEIMEGAVIKGPVYIGKGTKVHVGAKIYAGTMLGPQCRVGGEIKRTTIFGYSNKAHDGYLGDSVIGHWCNFGADTNNSNMKNTYGIVSLYDIEHKMFRKTGRQFLGMIIGDHTMCGINTSFNTGTVTGIFSNILDKNPERFVPSYSWGKNQKYQIDKALIIAKIAMGRRDINMNSEYARVVRHLSDQK